MSIRILAWVFDKAPTKSSTDQLVLLALADRCDDEGREAYPSMQTLARKTRLTRRAVLEALKRLEKNGVLLVRRRAGKHGTHRYEIRMEQAVAPVCEPLSHAKEPPMETSFTGACDAPSQAMGSCFTSSGEVRSPDPSNTPSTSSTSVQPSTGRAQASTASPSSVLEFRTSGSGPSMWRLTAEQLVAWREAYPHLDVEGECRRARAWVEANPSKRKTARGMPKFLVNWLNRAMDRSGARGLRAGASAATGRGTTGASNAAAYDAVVES